MKIRYSIRRGGRGLAPALFVGWMASACDYWDAPAPGGSDAANLRDAEAASAASDAHTGTAHESGVAAPGSEAGLSDASSIAPVIADAGVVLDAGPTADAASLPDAAVALDARPASDAAARFPFPPLEANGAPLEAPDRVWTYVEFPDTKCRDGSRAGISLSLRSASRKLLIFLEGGAYCFDAITCWLNPSNVDDILINSAKSAPTDGIFDLDEPRNPVRDWNIVYVPNCTGDGHGGANPVATDVPDGPTGQYFVGHSNLEKFLHRIVPTFADATDVLLVGMSSGGFGVLQNLVLVQRAFPRLRVRHVNDSGPPLSKSVIAECLQDKFRKLWRLDLGALADCGRDCPDPRNYLEDNAVFLAKTFADRPGGFIDSIEDWPMAMFYGLGLRDCTGTFLLDEVPAETFRSAILAYRERLQPFPNYGVFLAQGAQHTWLRDASFYTESSGGVTLVDWFAKIARGEAAGRAGP